MTAPDRTPERVVEELQKLIGIGESPPGSNCNAITHRFGQGCFAWCDENWWTALFNAGFNDGQGHIAMPGVSTDYALGDTYVPSTMRHFQAAGRFSPTPVPGAGEIHFWGGPETNSHIAGYVKDYGDGTHLNIEGNHNNVCEYVRRSNSDPTIMGYCTPAYVTAPVPPPVVTVPVHILEEAMFPVPPDAKAHDFPVPSWAKKLKALSNGTKAKVALGDGTTWVKIHNPDWWGPNLGFTMDVPPGVQVLEVVNWGSGQDGAGATDLNVIFDIA